MSVRLWFGDLLFWSVQVGVLVGAAAVFVKILRIREPRALLVCWRTLLGASLLLPFIEPWRRQQTPVLSQAPDVSVSAAIPAASTAVSRWHFPGWAVIAEILIAVVLAGIAVRLVMLALGLVKLRQLRRASAVIEPHVVCTGALQQARALAGRRAEFRLSADVESPVTFGFRSPVILLPEKFLQLDRRFQAAIACHELLHVRRRDWTHHLCEEALRAIFWFHPAILWLVSRIRLTREQVVDREVVRLTAARKLYVEALLEFTNGSRGAAIPAPLFLVERQLVERVALMLKEAGMSRRRLIASLSVVGCGLVAAAVGAVTVFPLKAAPPGAARAQEIEAVTEGVVERSKIWPDTVKRGTMYIDVRGLGTLALLNGRPVAKIELAETEAGDVRQGQSAEVDTDKGVVEGRVADVSPEVIAGTRSVFIVLGSAVPSGVDPHAPVEGTVVVSKLENVLYVGRPAEAKADSHVLPMFKLIDDGKEAERVQVEFGRVGVKTIQVLSGLTVGDTVILSDMSRYDKFDRVEIKGAS